MPASKWRVETYYEENEKKYENYERIGGSLFVQVCLLLCLQLQLWIIHE